MKISRRALLKGAGAAAAGASVLPLLADAALAHGDEMAGSPEPGHQEAGHEEAEPSGMRLRRWVMVIDLRACDGCAGLDVPPQCTQACNWARFVPENQQWIELFDTQEVDIPDTAGSFMPAPCMQCQNAPCVNVCPVGATFHAPEGTVLIDQERCIGCRLCMAACPYDRRFFNWGEPVQPPQVKDAPYNVQTQVPAMKGTVMKCDFCPDRTQAGGLPSCVEGCPRNAIYFGDLEEGIATNGATMVDLSQLLSSDGVHRYKEDLGTEPRVYYIPGHGQNASGGFDEAPGHGEEHGHGAEEIPAGKRRLMKDELEWPWRKINEELEKMHAGDTGPMSGEAM